MSGVTKKGACLVPVDARRTLDKLSKAALMDLVWSFAGLGTDETHDQILKRIADECAVVLPMRGDRSPFVAPDSATTHLRGTCQQCDGDVGVEVHKGRFICATCKSYRVVVQPDLVIPLVAG